jgi:hypothetical protein
MVPIYRRGCAADRPGHGTDSHLGGPGKLVGVEMGDVEVLRLGMEEGAWVV